MIHVTVTLSDWMYRSVVSKSVLTLHRDYFQLSKPLGAAGLRDRPQALRPAGGVADRARDAPEEDRLDLAAPGVPQDDPRHGRGGRAARLHAWRSADGDVVLVRARGRLGRPQPGEARGSAPRCMPGRARRRRATTPTGSRRSGCGSGRAAAGRCCAAPRPPSSPSAAPAPPGRRGAEAFRARNASPAMFRARNASGSWRPGRRARCTKPCTSRCTDSCTGCRQRRQQRGRDLLEPEAAVGQAAERVGDRLGRAPGAPSAAGTRMRAPVGVVLVAGGRRGPGSSRCRLPSGA